MDIQMIQTITSAAALLIGTAYVFGGLIVNIYLSQYGVTEYQILRIKYLVVGLVFLFSLLVMLITATVLLLGAIVLINTKIIYEQLGLTLAFSLVASIGLFILWVFARRLEKQTRSLHLAQYLALLLPIISFLFPVAIIIRRALVFDNEIYSNALLGLAVLLTGFGLFGFLYSYSYFIYGNPEFSRFDMIGVGTPGDVQLAGPNDSLSLLAQMGIPLAQPTLTDKLALIDETDSHYIVGIGPQSQMRVFKIDKELIKGIVYLG